MILFGIISASGATATAVGGEAHRFWRIQSIQNSGNPSYTGAGQIGFFEYDDGTANFFQTANVDQVDVGDEDKNQNNEKDFAMIPWLGETWRGTISESSQYIQIDTGVGNAVKVGKIMISASISDANYTIKDFSLQWSDDGIGWTNEFTVTGEADFSSAEVRTYTGSAVGDQDVVLINELRAFIPMGGSDTGVVVNAHLAHVLIGRLDPTGSKVGVYGMAAHVVVEP